MNVIIFLSLPTLTLMQLNQYLNYPRSNEHCSSPCHSLDPVKSFVFVRAIYPWSAQHLGLSCCSNVNYTRTIFCPQLILHTNEWLRWPTSCLGATGRFHNYGKQTGLLQLWMNHQSPTPLCYQWVMLNLPCCLWKEITIFHPHKSQSNIRCSCLS